MLNIKKLFILFFIVINLNASMEKDVVYVENLDSSEISLKDEFFNDDNALYTISIGTLTLERHDPIDFFKTYKMKNALVYKFGENKEFARVISGVYKTGREASENIKNLDPRLQRNKPYAAKLKRHQTLFKEDNGIIQKSPKKVLLNPKKNELAINKIKDSIYTSNAVKAKNLKKEFLNSKSKYYSIALGSITLTKSTIQNFFERYGIGDNALAHVYGKNKNKARIIYGLYKTKEEATKALSSFTKRLKENKPYSMKMSKFQSFYKKSFPDGFEKNIVELKVNDRENDEYVATPKLSDDIKILKKEATPKKILKKEIKPKTVKPKVKSKPTPKPKVKPKRIVKKRVIKKQTTKRVMKEDLNKSRFLKYSKLEDVYFIESNGNFNILNEVFLNDGSSFYTVDLGELKLKETSIEQFFIKNNIEDDSLAYKYGKNDEYARAIYGAYETKKDANKAIENLNISSKGLRVSNIKNHQKLYKEYHKNGYNTKRKKVTIADKKNLNSSFSYDGYKDDILFIESNGQNNLLKDEFFSRNSSYYTITLITFLKENMSVQKFLNKNGISNNALGYSIGAANNYYRIIYGLYRSSDEARESIRNLSFELRKNVPYISRIMTNQKKFESYNNRVLEEEIKNSQRIEF